MSSSYHETKTPKTPSEFRKQVQNLYDKISPQIENKDARVVKQCLTLLLAQAAVYSECEEEMAEVTVDYLQKTIEMFRTEHYEKGN